MVQQMFAGAGAGAGGGGAAGNPLAALAGLMVRRCAALALRCCAAVCAPPQSSTAPSLPFLPFLPFPFLLDEVDDDGVDDALVHYGRQELVSEERGTAVVAVVADEFVPIFQVF